MRPSPSWSQSAHPFACPKPIDHSRSLQQNSGHPPWRGLVQRCLALGAPAARLYSYGSCGGGNDIAHAYGLWWALYLVASCLLVQHLQLPQFKVTGGEPAAM